MLRHYLERGLSKASLARELGVSRRTIYHWIETGQLERELDGKPVCYGPRSAMPTKLDAYRGLIDARLAEYPALTATRLFDEVRAAGYTGGYTQVKVYVRQVRPRVAPEPVIRYETLPGQQGQVDFAEFRLPWGRGYALLVVLGYSRLLWLGFFPRQSMEVLMRGLESAFAFFGGAPAELLFDQMKAVVIEDRRAGGGALLCNAEFQRFAAHWNFSVRACRPYRAQTKGKVERPIRYVRQSFFYAREFLNEADLNAQAQRWMVETANRRKHRTLGESPQLRFERDERAALGPLAARAYQSLLPQPPAAPASAPRVPVLPVVERRPLSAYGALAEQALG
ncbi:IS21 family transposase [Arhodomonas sp. KWT2]|uniref:IS21 family transposase n=1 Tax=unclassified Arhodomonas TaxID=2621637 RepID=UPI001969D15D|nr:IS21 family transposase [Arhodomonas sp. KWT]